MGHEPEQAQCAFGVYPLRPRLTPTAPVNNQLKGFQNQLHTASVHWSGTFPLISVVSVSVAFVYLNNSQTDFNDNNKGSIATGFCPF